MCNLKVYLLRWLSHTVTVSAVIQQRYNHCQWYLVTVVYARKHKVEGEGCDMARTNMHKTLEAVSTQRVITATHTRMHYLHKSFKNHTNGGKNCRMFSFCAPKRQLYVSSLCTSYQQPPFFITIIFTNRKT